jgi:hypothetical protein
MYFNIPSSIFAHAQSTNNKYIYFLPLDFSSFDVTISPSVFPVLQVGQGRPDALLVWSQILPAFRTGPCCYIAAAKAKCGRTSFPNCWLDIRRPHDRSAVKRLYSGMNLAFFERLPNHKNVFEKYETMKLFLRYANNFIFNHIKK